MPKTLRFPKGSVIYFHGENAGEIFLIKSGSVVVSSDIHLGVEKKHQIDKGGFLGLHSALDKIPRQDDAIAVTDVELIGFDVDEFHKLITTKPNLSLQLMKMLSHELRSVHEKGKEIEGIDHAVRVDPESGLFMCANFFCNKKEYEKAKYVLEKFIEQYPKSNNLSKVRDLLASLDNGE